MVFIFAAICSLFSGISSIFFESMLTLFNMTPVSIPHNCAGPCTRLSNPPASRRHSLAVQCSLSTYLQHN
jgi:hypothetical protein